MIDWFYVGCLVVGLILFFAGGIYFQGTDWGISRSLGEEAHDFSRG